MGRRHYRIRRDEIIRLAQVVRIEQHEAQKSTKHDNEAHYVLDRVISVEGDLIRVPVDPEGIIPAGGVQEEDVQTRYRGDQERHEKVESEKAC